MSACLVKPVGIMMKKKIISLRASFFIWLTQIDINPLLMGEVLCPLVVRDTHLVSMDKVSRTERKWKDSIYLEVSGNLLIY